MIKYMKQLKVKSIIIAEKCRVDRINSKLEDIKGGNKLIYPSIKSLLNKVNNKYSLVVIAAKELGN